LRQVRSSPSAARIDPGGPASRLGVRECDSSFRCRCLIRGQEASLEAAGNLESRGEESASATKGEGASRSRLGRALLRRLPREDSDGTGVLGVGGLARGTIRSFGHLPERDPRLAVSGQGPLGTALGTRSHWYSECGCSRKRPCPAGGVGRSAQAALRGLAVKRLRAAPPGGTEDRSREAGPVAMVRKGRERS